MSQSRMRTVLLSDMSNLLIYNEVLEQIGKGQFSFVAVASHPSEMLPRY